MTVMSEARTAREERIRWPVRRAVSGRAEEEIDRAFVSWIGRFRFVTAELLAVRFGLSVQQVNARLRRIEMAGLICRSHCVIGKGYLVAITRRGCRAVGVPERRAPRGEVQREHELAVVALVATLERAGDGVRVFTERELRLIETLRPDRPASVAVYGAPRGDRRHWPDLAAVDATGALTAFEVELTLKGRARLWAILDAYAAQTTYARVEYRTPHEHIARRLNALVADQAPPPAILQKLLAGRAPQITVRPYGTTYGSFEVAP